MIDSIIHVLTTVKTSLVLSCNVLTSMRLEARRTALFLTFGFNLIRNT